ncbi:MAG: sortase domain-containing protein [Actinomycetes bacterium]
MSRARAAPTAALVLAACALTACAGGEPVVASGAGTPGVAGSPPPSPVVEAPDARETAAVTAVHLRVPAIDVDTDLEQLGLSRRQRLRPPADPALAGWFTGSAVPGRLGAAVIAGHRDSRSGPAVFWRLTDLAPGDRIAVTRSDGVTVRFRVAEVRRVARREFPTEDVYGATPDRTLRLITCGGLYDHVHGRYVDNVLVLALAVGSPGDDRPAQ